MSEPTRITVNLPLRLRAARHELTCWECRVTWRSWLQRLAGFTSGYSPKIKPWRGL